MLVWDAADGSVQGGAGTDTLRIDGSGITLNLTTIADTLISDIEVIDLTGIGNNTLTLALSDVLAISSTGDMLRIDGNSGDTLYAGSGWTQIADALIGSDTYHRYSGGSALLLVDADIAQYLSA